MNETPATRAFLDASVLYPALLRNILMRLALNGEFQARWSSHVQDEWSEALLRNRPDLTRTQVERTRFLMEQHIHDASVTGYDHLIEGLDLPDADDRHVLAAAIHCEAHVIVTMNLRDFPDSVLAGFEVEAVHPDAFISGLAEANPGGVLAVMRRLQASFKNPPINGDALLLEMRRQHLPATADALLVALASHPRDTARELSGLAITRS